MNSIVALALAAVTAIAAGPAGSASFSVLCDNPEDEIARKSCTIKLTGPIEPGDAQRLLRIIRKPQQPGWSYSRLVLDSPGGSIAAALELSAVVRQALLYTSTGRPVAARPPIPGRVDTYHCVSACFLVWVAGAQRITLAFNVPRRADGTSEIGLHRPYLERKAYERSPTEVAAMQQHATQLTADYLKKEQVPQDLVEKMLSRASTEVYWVGPDDTKISGMSPWFEEMMIARCGFDPTRSNEAARRAAERLLQRWAATGSLDMSDKAGQDARERQDEARSQQYFACQEAARASAQEALRR